nr:TonB-dependent receptor [Chitinophaga sedimenti]
MTPFSDYSDQRVFFVGNPNLNPEYSHSMEAGHLLEWDGGSILSSVYYRHKTGEVQRVSDPSKNGDTTYIRPINMDTRDDIGVEFNLSMTLTQWWKFNTSANFFHAESRGYFNGPLTASTTTMTNRTTSRMTFFKSLDFRGVAELPGAPYHHAGKGQIAILHRPGPGAGHYERQRHAHL